MKIRALVLLAAMLPGQAMAFTSLCVEDHSTGFNWTDGAWGPRTFTPQTYVLRKTESDEEIAEVCHNYINRNSPDSSLPAVFALACYALYKVGESPTMFDVMLCKERFFDEDISHIDCSEDGYNRILAQPSGEFVNARIYEIPMLSDPPRENRDSIVLSVGKCSVIAE